MPKPYLPEPTSKRFFIPRTLASDFTEFLDYDIPNTVMDFELLPNWFAKQKDDYVPHTIRMEIYPDASKSRYTNTDNFMNVRAAVDSGIKKGDMVVAPDGTVFVLDWDVALQSNNAPSRALRCNMLLSMMRYHEEETDPMGYLIAEEGYTPLFDNLPVNVYRYDGRPEFSAISGTPGVAPDALTIVTCQYNELTKEIRTDDKFIWAGETYVVIDTNYSGVHYFREAGVIVLQCKKVAGGLKLIDGQRYPTQDPGGANP